MSTSKLVLADSTEIKLREGSALGNVISHYAHKNEMLSDWDKLTKKNLKNIQIISDGIVVGNHADLILESETSTLQEDGSVDTIWNIREKTELEKLRDEITAIKETQGIHDGAIADLGKEVSTLTEGESE